MKRIILILALSTFMTTAWAGTFTANGGNGTSTVGSIGADYPNLDAAGKDFSSFVGGSTGNWTLLITTTTLTEPNNIAFGNNTNGFSVTVKPDTGLNSVITFTTTTANNAGAYTGNWLIGTSGINNSADAMTTTSNFTIDGSNDGSNSQNLTIQNLVIAAESQVIRVVGGTENSTFKNCRIISNGTGLNFNIEFSCRRANLASPSYFPKGCHITNCDLTLTTGSNAQNILFRQVNGAAAVTTGTAMDNITITSNTIKGIRQLINLGFVANASITDNILSMTVPLGSGNTPGCLGHGANLASGWTVTFDRNKIVNWETQAATATAGTQRGYGTLLDLNGGITAPLTGTYNVSNNFLTGFLYNSPTASGTNGVYRGVLITGSANVNLHHNSFNMTNTTFMTTPNRSDVYNAVAIAANYTGAINMKNNIIRYDQNNGVIFYRSPTGTTGTLTSDYNTFFLSSGAQMASYQNATTVPNKATLAAWQLMGFDLNSNYYNPTVAASPAPGKWTSATDLHFDADPGSVYLGSGVGITTDIDSQSRSLTEPVRGADELPISIIVQTSARDWQLLE